MLPAMPDVPMPVAIGFGLACLGAGALITTAIVRDKLAAARRLASRAATLEVKSETILHRVEGIVSPTGPMPLVQLVAATATPAERASAAVADLAARVREAISPTTATRDWEPGEMTAAFNRMVEQTPDWELPSATEVAIVDGLQPAPRRQPLAPPARPQTPALVRASGQPQPAPRWQDLPAPPRRPVSRGALAIQKLAARGRNWGTILGEVPPLELPKFPEPFRMPQQRPRPTPLALASLPADPTRQWRTKRVSA